MPRIARLLTGHELAAATVAAASSGNIRLATLLAQVRCLKRLQRTHCTVLAVTVRDCSPVAA